MAETVGLPPGFILDQPQSASNGLPEGFVLDAGQEPADEQGLIEKIVRLPETAARKLYQSGQVGQLSGVANKAALEGFPSAILGPMNVATFGYNKLKGGLNYITDAIDKNIIGREPPSHASEIPYPSDYYKSGMNELNKVVPVFRNPETAGQQLFSETVRGASSAYGGTAYGDLLAAARNPTVSAVGDLLRTTPGVQAAAGGSAGTGGELARQSGAGPVGQTLAAFGAGLLGGGLASYLSPTAPAARLPAGAATTAEQAATLRSAADNAERVAQESAESIGLNWVVLDEGLKDRLTSNAKQALETQSDLPPEAIARKALYESIGFKPTRALITRSFDDALNEQNLLTEQEGQALRNIYVENNQNIRSQLGQLAPSGVQPVSSPAFGQQFRAPVVSSERIAQGRADAAYRAAQAAEGGNTVDITRLNAFLNENAGVLNNRPATTGLLDDFKGMGLLRNEAASPELVPASPSFTLRKLANVRAATNEAWQTAKNTGDARAAGRLNELRGILDDMESSAGGELYKAYREIRMAKGDRFENNPLIDKLISDKRGYFGTAQIEDSQVFDAAVLRSSPEQFQKVWPRLLPKARDLTRAQLAKHIEDTVFGNQGMNEAGDVVASSAKLTAVLRSIGPEKLKTIYGENGYAKIERLGQVVKEISNPPRGTTPQGSAPKLSYLYQNTLGVIGLGGRLSRFNIIADMVEKRAATVANREATQRAISPLLEITQPKPQSPLFQSLPPSLAGILEQQGSR